ncbi:MAG: hypothetical protein MZV70_35570 [Desulfobacterales bacterium]|nr:hypothetical protein [Desulfobacterales bacterium]
MEDLEREKEKLVEQLTRLSRAFALQKKFVSADAEAIARALPGQAALVEFARINTFNFGAKGRRGRWLPARYLAFVLHAGKGGEVRLVDLGDAAEIDAAVARLKTERRGRALSHPCRHARTRRSASTTRLPPHRVGVGIGQGDLHLPGREPQPDSL